MIDDLIADSDWYFDKQAIETAEREREFKAAREVATNSALELCPAHIKEWLTDCTAGSDGKAYSTNIHGYDTIEWFEVGHNASHYFSFGVREDGVFIKKTKGDEYHEECQCWYNKIALRIVTLEEISKNYWGHH